jgi:uncharacterized membrane protein HdeD (DUF308 family)
VKKRPDNFWIQLFAVLVFGILGIITILTRHIGSWSVREMQASGRVAQFIGALFLIMSVMTLVDWIKKESRNR